MKIFLYICRILLKDFINSFIEPNTLIKLWMRAKNGYEQVSEDVFMEWKLAHGNYADREVIGIKDILCVGDPYIEAVNIVISRI